MINVKDFLRKQSNKMTMFRLYVIMTLVQSSYTDWKFEENFQLIVT